MEMTAVIPRDQLPPISQSDVVALDLDPVHPETQEMLQRAQEGSGDRETMVRCPECATCPCCQSGGMTTFSRAAEWSAKKERAAELQKTLENLDEPGS